MKKVLLAIYRIPGFECVANHLRMALYKPDCVSNYCVASGAYILICHCTYSLCDSFVCDLYTKTRNNAIERALHSKPGKLYYGIFKDSQYVSSIQACATEGYSQLHSPVYGTRTNVTHTSMFSILKSEAVHHFKFVSFIAEEIGKFKKALQSCNHELIVCMNVQSMLPYLQQEALLTTNEYEKLTQAVKTPSEQNQYLLGILPTKGERACERFVKCLSLANEHSGHAHLVTLLSSVV